MPKIWWENIVKTLIKKTVKIFKKELHGMSETETVCLCDLYIPILDMESDSNSDSPTTPTTLYLSVWVSATGLIEVSQYIYICIAVLET